MCVVRESKTRNKMDKWDGQVVEIENGAVGYYTHVLYLMCNFIDFFNENFELYEQL